MNAIKSSTAAKFTAFILFLACSWAMCIFALRGFLYGMFVPHESPGTDFLKYVIDLIPVTRSIAYLLTLIFGILALAFFVFLVSASGHHAGTEGITPSWGTRIPLEIDIALAGAALTVLAFFIAEGADEFLYMNSSENNFPALLGMVTLFSVAALAAFTGLCMSGATRLKLGGWWKGTLCCMLLVLLWRVFAFLAVKTWSVVKYIAVLLLMVLKGLLRLLKGIWNALVRFVRGFFGGIGRLISGIPLVWKGCLATAAFFFIQLVFVINLRRDTDMLVMSLFAIDLIGGAALLYAMLCMKKLQNGATALANGDLAYKVDTKHMVLDFKSHGENLNRLAQGTNLAVEQRLKSERFKTELITNVSHDIKTPLTSIINYSELIGRETARIMELQAEDAGAAGDENAMETIGEKAAETSIDGGETAAMEAAKDSYETAAAEAGQMPEESGAEPEAAVTGENVAEAKDTVSGIAEKHVDETAILRNDSIERISDYSEVLHRQSEKLKKLLEDLLEASKASTGNLDVCLDPCDAGIFISQTQGEYEEKLQNAGLSLICSKPDEPVRILADGRRMQRIFDNLMNNICKYSFPGSRVYLDLKKEGDEAVITFRNTSANALNISPDELMERFVRGDASRASDGSGLGLSIARSLTELQRGKMSVGIDGDLFKVVLAFKTI